MRQVSETDLWKLKV